MLSSILREPPRTLFLHELDIISSMPSADPPGLDLESRYRALLAATAREFPGFTIVHKNEDVLQRSIHAALAVLTLGGQRRYLQDFVTTLGARVYVPADWDLRSAAERYCTLRHERVHLAQFARHGFVRMALLYLVFPLPVFLAWGRMRIEAPAYAESIRAAFEVHGRAHVCSAAFRRHVVAMFTGPAYAWMWPFPRAVERWYDDVLASLPVGPG